jgi:hypothetical protein
VHTVVPLAFVQPCPQAPQLVTDVFRFVSQPLLAIESQLPNPPVQVGTQPPVVHVVVPLEFVQTLPQEPQLATAVLRFTSQPVDASPSQLPNPLLHATAHALSAQLAVPFVPLQTVPQAPQFATAVLVFVSHPFGVRPSQLPKPELQAPSTQALLTQEVAAWAKLQTFPQLPQLETLFVRFVSHPLPERPSQLPRPGLQLETPHTPPTQFAVPPTLGHTLPQVLQLLTSVLVLVSQPLFGFPSQFLKPAEQLGTQAPAVHVVVPLEFVQVSPQTPQLAVVFSAVSHPLRAFASQLPKPAVQVGTQAPAVHTVVPLAFVQASPQPPQCATVDWVLVSHPLFGRLSQLPQPAVQLGVQVPLGHVVVPCAFVQAVPQVPQFVVVFSEASHPFVTSASQLPKLALHVIEHTLSAQPAVPLLLLQTVPHVPQLDTLFWVLISHPLPGRPSQFPKPALQVPSEQLPEAQDSPAFARSQTAPQVPQFERVVRLVSQPFAELPSQLAKPALQVPSWHAPLKHVAPAFAKLQTVPQAPQFEALVFVFVSHPSDTRPLQLPKPPAHVREHVPAAHAGVALVVEHAAAQEPQFVALVFVFVSQPSDASPLQLPKPALQVPRAHVPEAHVSDAFVRSQMAPHAPQLVSVRVFVSQPLLGLPSQLAKPAAQLGTHAPAVHTVVPLAFVQAAPQALQLPTLVFRFASHPSGASPLQLPNPALQVPSTQALAEQLAPAFAKAQTFPHEPQLLAVVVRFVSHPFVALPSQLPHPGVQVGTQAPVVQVVVPCGFVQAVPQEPQLVTVVFRLVSQPSDATALQLAKPAPQVPSVQTPPGQLAVAFARLQAKPQPPQSVRVVMLFSQPLAAFPSQLAKPDVHTGTQAPAEQLVVPLPLVHPVPHAPQLAVVLSDVSHPVETRPSQLPKPVLQPMLHAPSEQFAVPLAELHAAPQAPQLDTVESVFVSHPFAGFASQLAKPAAQAPSVHTPDTHVSLAFARLHTAPQAPQLGRLVFRFVSHPSAPLPLQSPSPGLQTVMPQTPATQLGVPPVAGHALPHAPQFETLVWVFTSQPLDGLPSQFSKPAVHVPSVQVPDAHDSVAFARSHAAPQTPQFVRVARLVSQSLPARPSQLP